MPPHLRHRFARAFATTALLAGVAFGTGAVADVALTPFNLAVAEAAAADEALAPVYRASGFEGVWAGSDDAARDRRNAFLSALRAAPMHGLPVARYDVDGLIAGLRAAETPQAQARMDVTLSATFLRYAADIHSGMLDPGATVGAIRREAPVLDGAATLAAFLEAGSPAAFLRDLAPDAPEYARLLRNRIALEETIAAGGWGPALTGAALAPGASGDGVVALRDRLIRMAYLDRSITRDYDAAIEAAVRAFQAAHGLAEDGVAGGATLTAINVVPEARLERILVALERERWLNVPRGDRHIWVNLTDFHASIVDMDRVTFTTRSVIGALGSDRQTPEFSDEMTHMVINPSWYVPRSIVVGEYLPSMRANPNAAGQMQIIDSNGRVVPRSAIDFSRYSAATFPYGMRQPPSRSNALGLVKFMFPNQYNIYLHDTPAQSLFQTPVRAYSHGCVRLDDPYDFAYTLLAAQTDDPVGFFDSRLASGNETRVNLDTPIPVHIVYRTAFTDVGGRMQYRDDIYGRDAAIWSALRAAGVEIATPRG